MQMSLFKVTYADLSEEVLAFEGEAEQLFEQLFSGCSEEIRSRVSVVEHTVEGTVNLTESSALADPDAPDAPEA